MKLFIDANTREILDDQHSDRRLTRVDFTRGDTAEIELVFINGDNEVVTLASPFSIKFGIKNKLDYDGDFLVYSDSFTSLDSVYSASPDFNTSDLSSALASSPFIETMLEIEWIEDSKRTTTIPTVARVYNDVIKGGEGAPTQGNPTLATESALQAETANRIAGDAVNVNIGDDVAFQKITATGEILATSGLRRTSSDTDDDDELLRLAQAERFFQFSQTEKILINGSSSEDIFLSPHWHDFIGFDFTNGIIKMTVTAVWQGSDTSNKFSAWTIYIRQKRSSGGNSRLAEISTEQHVTGDHIATAFDPHTSVTTTTPKITINNGSAGASFFNINITAT